MIFFVLFHIYNIVPVDKYSMTYILMGLAALSIIILISIFTDKYKQKGKSGRFQKQNNTGNNNGQNEGGVKMVNCPMCNTPLQKGQNLISKVFRPMNVPDQRCNISGCPHCYPQPEPGVKRQCPCCGKEVPVTGYLVARLFNYKDNKKHVRVTGCSRCCER